MIARAVSQQDREPEPHDQYRLPLDQGGLVFLLVLAGIGGVAAALAIFGT